MKTLYQTQVTAEGGRVGHVRSVDGTLDLPLSPPYELGGTGGAVTNPGQLFATGYAAYFENTVLHVACGKQIKLTSTPVTATASIGPREDGGFALTVLLSATLGGIDQVTAGALVAMVHGVCPYSHAVRGNIDVQLNATTRWVSCSALLGQCSTRRSSTRPFPLGVLHE